MDGRFRWWSDVDLFGSIPDYPSLQSERQIDLYLYIYHFIEDKTTIRNLELTVLEQVPISVKSSTIQKGRLLGEKQQGLYHQFKEIVMNKYYDYKIWIDQFHQVTLYD